MAQPDPPGGKRRKDGNAIKDLGENPKPTSASSSNDAPRTADQATTNASSVGQSATTSSQSSTSNSGDIRVPTPNASSSSDAPTAGPSTRPDSFKADIETAGENPESVLDLADIFYEAQEFLTTQKAEEFDLGDIFYEAQEFPATQKAEEVQDRRREQSRLATPPQVTIANPQMQENLSVSEQTRKTTKLVSTYRWADAEDDEELSRRLGVQMSDPWRALDTAAVVPEKVIPRDQLDRRRQPLCAFQKIPDPVIKTNAFYAIIQDPTGTSHYVLNNGPHGFKNCNTRFFLDGGKNGCPVIRFEIELSANPTVALRSSDPNSIHIKAILPCGPVMMADGLWRAFADDKFKFHAARTSHPSEEGRRPREVNDGEVDLFKRMVGPNATAADIEPHIHRCVWRSGGGVIFEDFEKDIVQKIKNNPTLYHEEAAQNIAALEKLAIHKSRVGITFVIGGHKQELLVAARTHLECFRHSVENGHIFHYQYLDKDGKFTWNMPSIREVGEGMHIMKSKHEGERIRVRPLDKTHQGLQSFMIQKACADLRELQFQEASRNELAINLHRAYVVGPTAAQCEDRSERAGEEIYTVFITLSAHGTDINEIMPEPASTLSVKFENTTKAVFEDPRHRWRGPVIYLPAHELHGCHFAMFAIAKKGSIMQKAYPRIEDAKAAGGLPVHLKFEMQNRISPRLRDAFKHLFKPQWRQFALILMGRYGEAAKVPRDPKRVLFGVKNSDFPDRTLKERQAMVDWAKWLMEQNSTSGLTNWGLNSEQMEAVLALSNSQMCKMVKGPPGTGKSHTGGCAVWASLAASDRQSRVLVVASSNEATDAIAAKIKLCCPEDERFRKAIVIRLHVEAAEQHHAKEHDPNTPHPLAERRGQESERIRETKSTFRIASLQQFTTEKMHALSATAKEAHERHIAKFGLSLAEAMWRQAILIVLTINDIPEAERESSDVNSLAFARLYREVVKKPQGGVLDAALEKRFNEAYNFLAQVTLTKASVVVTTCANAASPQLTRYYKPDYLFVDESGQVLDTELITAATAFKSVRQIVLLGDPNQLEPIVTSGDRNEFSESRRSTLIARAVDCIDCTHLVTQYRMTPAIAFPVNTLFYNGELRNAEGLEMPNDTTSRFRRFISEYFWKGKKPADEVSEVLFVDVVNSKSWKDEDGSSRVNDPEAQCTVDITEALLHYEKRSTPIHHISIICMYKSQVIYIRNLLKKRIGDDAASVGVFDISTVDAFHGKENEIVLLNLVHQGIDEHDKRVSVHLQDSRRLCVALSRARSGFITVGDFHGLKRSTDNRVARNKIRKVIPLFRLLGYYEKQKLVFVYDKSHYKDNSKQCLDNDSRRNMEISETDSSLRRGAQYLSYRKRSGGGQFGNRPMGRRT